jgi:hypothetical protein
MSVVRRALLLAWLLASGALLPVVLAPFVVPAPRLHAVAARCRLEHPGGEPCPLCGMTRAWVSIGEGRWNEARQANAVALPLYLLLSVNELAAALVLIFRRRDAWRRIIGVGVPMKTLLALVVCGGLWAAEKPLPAGEAANEKIRIRAWLLNDAAAVRRELGSDLGGYYTVVRLEVAPKGAEPLPLHPDDFLLRSDKDGQRCGPLAPSQIAGRGVLMVSSKAGGGMMAENPGPVWGGWPGPPRRLGGESAVIGNASESTAQATARNDAGPAEDPLLATLKSRSLPQGETAQSVSGLLYFLLEGKHKPKNLELQYHGPAGKLSLRFR